jgi:hypothetical protein
MFGRPSLIIGADAEYRCCGSPSIPQVASLAKSFGTVQTRFGCRSLNLNSVVRPISTCSCRGSKDPKCLTPTMDEQRAFIPPKRVNTDYPVGSPSLLTHLLNPPCLSPLTSHSTPSQIIDTDPSVSSPSSLPQLHQSSTSSPLHLTIHPLIKPFPPPLKL